MRKFIYRVILLLLALLLPILLLAQTNPGTENLKHKWTFTNGSVTDEVGHLDGILRGKAVISNNALLTANGGYFELPAEQIAINTYPELTMSVWFISNGTNSSDHPITWFGKATSLYGEDYLSIQTLKNNSFMGGISCQDSTAPWATENHILIPPINDVNVHNAVTVLDSVTIKLYIDGVLVGIDTLSEKNRISYLSTANAYLAKGGYAVDPTWKGLINEFSLYNKALTDNEVLYLFQQKTEGDRYFNVFSTKIIFDSSYRMEAFTIINLGLTNDINIVAPDGITVTPNIISFESYVTQAIVSWDGNTNIDGNIYLTSGSTTISIEVKNINDFDCFNNIPSMLDNLIPDPGLNKLENFSGWGIKTLVNVFDDPENVYCGVSSIRVGDGISSGSGTLDVNSSGILKPNTSYTTKFMAKTTGGFARLGITGINASSSLSGIKTFDTEGAWQEIVFNFTTGDSLGLNQRLFINNWNTTCTEIIVDNWVLYETSEIYTHIDQLPNYVPKNDVFGYFDFSLEIPYDLFTMNYYNPFNIEFVADRNGLNNGAIKFVSENQSSVVLLGENRIYENFALNTWVKPGRDISLIEEGGISYENTQNLLILPNHGGNTEMGIGLSVGTNGVCVYGHSSNIITSLLTYATPINDFTNISVNVSKTKIELFVNGLLVKSNNMLYPEKKKYIFPYYMGNNSTVSLHFDGTVDELGFWSRTLSNEEIRKYYISTFVKVYTQNKVVVNGKDFTIPLNIITIIAEDSIYAYQFDFSYDTTHVEYQGLIQENTMSQNANVVVNDKQKGKLRFAAIEQGFFEGSGALIELKFKAIKAGVFLPEITNFLMNTDTIDKLSTDSIYIFTRYGDVDGNDFIQAYDASLALKKSVGLDPIPSIDPIPWEEWRITAANVDGFDSISAYDASLILQRSIDLIDSFPVERENTSAMLMKSNNTADIIITKEYENLIVRSIGNLTGLNFAVTIGSEYLDAPTSYANEFIKAENINNETYKIGMASTSAVDDNSILMVIPVKNEVPVEVIFDVIVNTDQKTIKMQVPTGISSEYLPELMLYPNPTNGYVSIDLGTTQLDQMSYKIINLTGQTVSEGNLNNRISTINLSGVLPGMYSIQIINDKKVLSIQKLIIK